MAFYLLYSEKTCFVLTNQSLRGRGTNLYYKMWWNDSENLLYPWRCVGNFFRSIFSHHSCRVPNLVSSININNVDLLVTIPSSLEFMQLKETVKRIKQLNMLAWCINSFLMCIFSFRTFPHVSYCHQWKTSYTDKSYPSSMQREFVTFEPTVHIVTWPRSCRSPIPVHIRVAL